MSRKRPHRLRTAGERSCPCPAHTRQETHSWLECQLREMCCAAEHEARLKAEASADNHLQRLAVHSQQVSEYAIQKATDFDEIRNQVCDCLLFMQNAGHADSNECVCICLAHSAQTAGFKRSMYQPFCAAAAVI